MQLGMVFCGEASGRYFWLWKAASSSEALSNHRYIWAHQISAVGDILPLWLSFGFVLAEGRDGRGWGDRELPATTDGRDCQLK